MNERFQLKRGIFGGHTLHYKCQYCSIELKSPLSDAGKTDSCPECGRAFVVPGAKEKESIAQAQVAAAEEKRKAKEERKLAPQAKAEEENRRRHNEAIRADAERLHAKQEKAEQLSDSCSCPYCGETVLKIAKKCKHCGEMLDEELRKDQDGSNVLKPNQTQAESVSGLVGCLVMFLLMGGCIVWVTNGSRPEPGWSGPTSSVSSDSPDEIAAWVMAQEFVERQLKSPGTASYGGIFSGDYQDPNDVVTSIGSDEFRVRAWVDSQNSFGATLRTNFICELKYLGNDEWRCTRLEFDE